MSVLPYIAGGLGASEDEASWVVTTYLVANAVIVTATSFLANRLGRKTFFLRDCVKGGGSLTG
jgi:MFS transporter, DHA2 family, multidrug resistance protein